MATAGQAEIDMKFDTLLKMADQVLWYKYIVKNVARQHGKTATFMPKPLFGDNGSRHAHAPVAVEERQAAVRRRRLRGPERHGAVLHRRPPEARRRDLRVREPDDQQLPPPGPGLRGAGQPGVLGAQPLGVDPHPDVLGVAQGQAARAAVARTRRATRTSRSPR